MTPIETLFQNAAVAADMLEELGADHTADVLRRDLAQARASAAGVTEWQKNLLLLAAGRYEAETERLMVNAASLKTQAVFEEQLAQLRAAKAWIECQPVKP